MTEQQIDPEKYRGMNVQEAQAAMEADRIRTINEHPNTIAAVEAMEERQAAEQAEERR